MNKMLIVILLFLIAALSGCTDSKETLNKDMQKYERTNPDLDAKIAEVKFDRENIIAGEDVLAELIVANTGNELITSETIEIKAKLITLESFWANLFSKFMDDEKKTRTFTKDFDTEIKPSANGRLSSVFTTVQEMQGYNLAGTYEVTVELFVNGQYADREVLQLILHEGTPEEITFTPAPVPTRTVTPAPTPTPALTSAPTPTPAPVPVVIATPTGKVIYSRIKGDRFVTSRLQINAGDEVLWDNLEDMAYTIVEVNGKITNITVGELEKVKYIFDRTGDYRFGLYYRNMQTQPSIQDIIVRVNASS